MLGSTDTDVAVLLDPGGGSTVGPAEAPEPGEQTHVNDLSQKSIHVITDTGHAWNRTLQRNCHKLAHDTRDAQPVHLTFSKPERCTSHTHTFVLAGGRLKRSHCHLHMLGLHCRRVGLARALHSVHQIGVAEHPTVLDPQDRRSRRSCWA